jgi:hypothetical protein
MMPGMDDKQETSRARAFRIAGNVFLAIEFIGAFGGGYLMCFDQRSSHAWLAAYIYYVPRGAVFSLFASIPISLTIAGTTIARSKK